MAQALTAFFIFMVVAGGIMVTLNRRTRNKMKEAAIADGAPAAAPEPKQRALSKRQQRIVSTLEPMKEAPSIEDLVAAEAADTGVNEIAGGDGLDVSLKLRVYWRDEVVRNGCEDGALEFRIEDGIDPANAETDDVRLVCVRDGVVIEAPAAVASADNAASTAADSTTADNTPAEDSAAEETSTVSSGDFESTGNFEAGLDVD